MIKTERFRVVIRLEKLKKLRKIIAASKAAADQDGSPLEITPSVDKKLFTALVHLEATGDEHRVDTFQAAATQL